MNFIVGSQRNKIPLKIVKIVILQFFPYKNRRNRKNRDFYVFCIEKNCKIVILRFLR